MKQVDFNAYEIVINLTLLASQEVLSFECLTMNVKWAHEENMFLHVRGLKFKRAFEE